MGGTRIGEEENGQVRLLEGEEETDIRVKGRENDIAFLTEVVHLGQYGIDKGVKLHSICVHLLLFGLVKHGVFHLDVKSDCLRQLRQHFFKGCEGGLDGVSSAVAFEAFLFKIACMLHTLAHIDGFFMRCTDRTRTMFSCFIAPLILDRCLGYQVGGPGARGSRCPNVTNVQELKKRYHQCYLQKCWEANLFQGKCMHWGIDTRFAHKKVMVDYGNVVLCQLYIWHM